MSKSSEIKSNALASIFALKAFSEVPYMTWLEAYNSLREVEAVKLPNNLYWELANLVSNGEVCYGKEIDSRDTELVEFMRKRKNDVDKKKTILKDYISFSQKCSEQGNCELNKSVALFALIFYKNGEALSEYEKEFLPKFFSLKYGEGILKEGISFSFPVSDYINYDACNGVYKKVEIIKDPYPFKDGSSYFATSKEAKEHYQQRSGLNEEKGGSHK